MKRLSGLIFLLACQSHFIQDASAFNPRDKGEEFEIFLKAALSTCDNALIDPGIQPEQCRKIIIKRNPDCVKKLWHKSPTIFTKDSESSAIGRDYFDCVRPGYFCDGVEIRPGNNEQWRNHCLDPNQPPMG